ncbi:MAG: hypothetical protein ABJE95_24565 [Byssovorax sp.]
MSRGRRGRVGAAAIAAIVAAATNGCTAPPAVDRCPPPASAAIVAAATVSAAPPVAPPPRRRDPGERALDDGAIVALAPAAGIGPSAGILAATLADPAGSATVTLSLVSAPTAYRRPLAFARLATALGMHVVPATVARQLGAGEIAALLEPQPEIAALLGGRLRVLADGTVTALLAAPAPGALLAAWDPAAARRVEARASYEVRTWERWAASPDPAAGEDRGVTRDFVEMLVLDYLAANAARRTVLMAPGRDALVLDDNREAFPVAAERVAVDQLLRRLKPIARFPGALLAALTAFDRERAREVLAPPGSFEDWLVSPRGLVELDERRAGLLSLIQARVAERGDAAVLSL